MRKRTMTGVFMIARSVILLAVVVAATPALLGQGRLVSGQPSSFSKTGTYSCLGPGLVPTCYVVAGIFNIDVPQGSTRLDVTVTVNPGKALVWGFIHFGSDITQTTPGAEPNARTMGPVYDGTSSQAYVQAGDPQGGDWSLQPGTWTIGVYMAVTFMNTYSTSGTILATTSVGPLVSSISPNSSAASGPAFTLTVNGTGFVSGSTVLWNGSALATNYVSATQLTASVSASLIASQGSAYVTVLNPGGAPSNGVTFTITAANPTISLLSPTSATAGSPAFTLTITGSGFVAGSAVQWNGLALSTNYVSGTQLTASVPANQIASQGTASVTVVNPGGATSKAATFTINAPTPSISSLSPNSATAGGPAFTLTLNGSGFLVGSAVQWNGSALSANQVSGTQLTASVPASQIASQGTASVIVVNPGGVTSNAATFTINAPTPSISVNSGGAVNAASYSPVGLPNSAIAQGSIFNVFGKNLGPASIVYAGFPLPPTLAGTSAKVTVNGTAVSAIMIYTVASQLAMVMPSNTPTGSGTITVTYNGQTSAPVALQVASTNFGIFSVNQAGSGPAVVTDANNGYISLTHAASPLQTLVLWGTGLGKISADETQPPPQGNVGAKPTVWVGSQQANVVYWGRSGCCGGLDQINFQVPAGTTGCYVPVAVQTGGTVSNFGSIAVASSASVCSDPVGLSSAQLTLVQNGQSLNLATLLLSRSTVSLNFPPPFSSTSTTTDSGSASFVRYTPTQLTSSGFGQAASVGGCMVFTFNGTATVADPVQPLGLDAGASIAVSGPNGSKTLQPAQSSKGSYGASLGTNTPGPLYLDSGTYTFNVPGGADVGAFTQQLQMPPSLTWTNQSSIGSVSESQGVTLNWTNAVPNGYVRVTGYAFAMDSHYNLSAAGAIFMCTANAGSTGSGSFAVPVHVLLSLPVSGTYQGFATPWGYLGISSETAAQSCTAPHIDVCIAQASVLVEKDVYYWQ